MEIDHQWVGAAPDHIDLGIAGMVVEVVVEHTCVVHMDEMAHNHVTYMVLVFLVD